jgi:signal transduction histidine kinase
MRPVDLLVLDALIAVAAAALSAAAASEAPVHGGPHEPAWLSLLAGVTFGLTLFARRRWPVSVAVIITAASAVVLLTRVVPDYAAAGPAVAVAISLYALGLLAPGGRSSLVALLCLAGLSVALASVADGLWSVAGAIVVAAVITAPAWVAGRMVRERREAATGYRAHLIREAATEERLRVARDLHDVVGHTLSLIAVKASVALHVADERPEEALDALRAIESTSRDALLETRQLLGALRDDEPRPAPRHFDMRFLADRASAGGVRVHLEMEPDALDHVSDPLARSVYRILQEALTNVVKHAAPTECHASVSVNSEVVRIEVVDDGSRPVHHDSSEQHTGWHHGARREWVSQLVHPERREPPESADRSDSPNSPERRDRRDRPGHGLIGMRERAWHHGGSFEAGPRPEGGFAVTALLPRTRDSAASQPTADSKPTAESQRSAEPQRLAASQRSAESHRLGASQPSAESQPPRAAEAARATEW